MVKPTIYQRKSNKSSFYEDSENILTLQKDFLDYQYLRPNTGEAKILEKEKVDIEEFLNFHKKIENNENMDETLTNEE